MAAPRAAPTPSTAPARSRALDNLKVLLIAGIIVVHAVAGYSDLGGDVWAYSEVRETTLADVTFVLIVATVFPFGMFLIALLFLVAGLLTPGSFERKGPGRFLRDRLLRLGVPYAVTTLLYWPAVNYALFRGLGEQPGSYWAFFVREFPTGSPLWFVAVLLVLSLLYAGWRSIRPAPTRARPLTAPTLGLVAAGVAASSFLLRLVWPYGGGDVAGLHPWQWPECAALFALGVAAAGHGWLTAVPEPLRRTARTLTLAAAAGVAVLVALPLGFPIEYAAGGPHWQALVVSTLEGLLTVFGSVWFLSIAQRHLTRPLPHGPALARASYGAFVLQGVLLYGVAVALRPVPFPAEVKALVVAVVAVAGSFALAHLLVTRVPLLHRVL
jgi:hypothetical protein